MSLSSGIQKHLNFLSFREEEQSEVTKDKDKVVTKEEVKDEKKETTKLEIIIPKQLEDEERKPTKARVGFLYSFE